MNASYTLVRGTLSLAALGGFGRRVFAIESSDPTRTPDSSYDYLIAGAIASIHLGRVAVVGTAAFEPVVGGAEPEQMDFGSASRWALDVAAGVEVQATSHLYVRAMADYQQFSWSWDMAGARGAGGATDAYPSATVQLGARYLGDPMKSLAPCSLGRDGHRRRRHQGRRQVRRARRQDREGQELPAQGHGRQVGALHVRGELVRPL